MIINKYKFLNFFLCLIIILALVGCKKDNIEIKMLNETKVEVGSSIILENDYDNDNAIYSVNDESIALIEGRLITGLKKGNVVITCIIGELKTEFDFEVINPIIRININGSNTVFVGEKILLKASLSKDSSEEIEWEIDDDGIASISKKDSTSAYVKGITSGKVVVKAKILDSVCEFPIEVIEKIPDNPAIIITCDTSIIEGKTTQMNIEVVGTSDTEYKISSSNEEVATITQDGLIAGVKAGKVVITIFLVKHPEIVSKFNLEVIDMKTRIELSGETEMMQGKFNYLTYSFKGDGVDNMSHDVEWSTSDPKIALVYEGIVLAVNKGEVVITATSVENSDIAASIKISVEQFVDKTVTSEEDLKRVDEIMARMTLDQKIGQMFIVGFSGTTFTDTLSQAINDYHFGNIIYMGANVSKPSTIAQMSNDIQNKMIESNGIPAFISTDQEGGSVARLTTKATHFVSNMAVCASNDVNNSYEMGKAVGFELSNYGINMDLAPVMDVNNNPNNPIIGIRSYSDNPMRVALFGSKMYQGLEESGVVGCVKHFPGHGNTSTDSHTGLPVITSTKDELYQTELAPFISSISNGVGAIMTTHIMFTAIDNKYPATLSKKVLTDLLRDELGYKGLIITDGMQMAGVAKNYGNYSEVAVKAVLAGVDILTYTSNDAPRDAFNGIKNAIQSGDITVDRINESVKRILLSKIKYGIMDNYLVEDKNIDAELAKNTELNYKIAMDALTVVKGDFKLDQTKSTLLISVTSNYTLDKIDGNSVESNSLACYSATYLKSKGYNNCDYYTTSNPIKQSQYNELLEKVKNYDQVIVAFSNVKTTNETISINFMNDIYKLKKENLLAVALNTPYDLLAYNNVENYVCLYTNQNATIVAFAKWLNGEFEAHGKSPIDENLFK